MKRDVTTGEIEWAICRTCGREFRTPARNRYATECERCYYRRNYGARKKPKPKAPARGIEAVLEEQRKIHEQTGRWITYGELMAKKRR